MRTCRSRYPGSCGWEISSARYPGTGSEGGTCFASFFRILRTPAHQHWPIMRTCMHPELTGAPQSAGGVAHSQVCASACKCMGSSLHTSEVQADVLQQVGDVCGEVPQRVGLLVRLRGAA